MILQVQHCKQATDWSCAVACLEMAATFKGATNLDQKDMYNRLKEKSRVARDQWCVSMASLDKEAHAMGFQMVGQDFSFTDVPTMVVQIKYVLEQHNTPIIAFQRAQANSQNGHARLIIGVEDPREGEAMPVIVVLDPSTRGVPVGGQSRRWKADIFAAMWKPNLSITGGFGCWLVP